MAERLLILGAGIMQWPAIKTARDMGFETVVVDADPMAPCVALADHFERIDLKNKEAIETLARAFRDAGGLSGVFTAGTDFSASVAWVAEKLSLPGIPYEAALNASDKERMRRCFKEAGVPSPDFLVINDLPPMDFSLPFAYPVVVKPVDNMGARGCRRADSLKELKIAAKEALKASRSGRAIVEEYIDGPEYSIDALIYEGKVHVCGFADRIISFPPYFVEMGHTIPTALDQKTQDSLTAVFIRGVQALGLTHGAAKGDVKLSSRGPMIGEIAARLSGGYMSGWTYPYSSGVEPTRGAILAALGKTPEGLEPVKDWISAERAFISIPGRVHSIFGVNAVRGMENIKDLFMRVKPGNRVRFPKSNIGKCGNVISAAPSRGEAVDAAERAARMVLLRLEVPNMETEDFLLELNPVLSSAKYPPAAFSIPENLRVLLAMFPEPEFYLPPGRTPEISIFPFLDFTESDLRDYMGRTVKECLDAVRAVTGLELPMAEGENIAGGIIMGKSFWTAMIRGGYQGAAYVVDRIALKLQARSQEDSKG
ncbi:MAG: ATP-grasp domain-containing protein [Treponema sp.]|nr:ATP-grasp domain-containing protein [Treponema sp.]